MDLNNEGRLGAYEPKGVIQDSIHGFIPINDAEYWLLQTPFLRRLHGVKQLGMAFLVFPSARHSRLEHSLGVMHLASMIAAKVVSVAKRDQKVCDALASDCDRFAESLIQVARLAGLLHDIGHLAYSHMSEEAVKDLALFAEGRGSKALFEELTTLSGGNLKVHEAYTQVFIDHLLKLVSEDPRAKKLKDLEGYLMAAKLSLTGSSTRSELQVLEDLGLSEGSVKVIHDIISNEIADADRLDYLQRDAQATGIVYGNIDIARLIHGITLTIDPDGKPLLGLDIKSLQTLEDIFDARYKMYRSVYFHHKVLAFSKAIKMFMKALSQEWEPGLIPLYGNDSLPSLLLPSRLAEAIMNDAYYFDDSELDYMVKVYAARGQLTRRWALSLLDRRDLVHVSIFKRSEELVLIAEDVLRSKGLPETPQRVAELMEYVVVNFKSLIDDVKKAFSDRLELDFFKSSIVDAAKLQASGLRVFNWNDSLYLRGLAEEAKIPVVLLYAYSNDERFHADSLRPRADDLRKYVKDKVRDLMKEAAG